MATHYLLRLHRIASVSRRTSTASYRAIMTSHPDTKIDCSKVYVKRSSFATDDNDFDGAFAAVALKKGTGSLLEPPSTSGSLSLSKIDRMMESEDSHSCFFPLIFWNNDAGELVEKGTMRRLPDGFDGNTCPFIFTWSNERPNKIWGMGSGCSAYYNTVRKQASKNVDTGGEHSRTSVSFWIWHSAPSFSGCSLTSVLCCFDLLSQDKKGVANTRMERFFDEDRFEIYATRKSMLLSCCACRGRWSNRCLLSVERRSALLLGRRSNGCCCCYYCWTNTTEFLLTHEYHAFADFFSIIR